MKMRLPLGFSIEDLQADLARVSDDEWIAHYNSGDHEGSWHLAALMAPAGMQSNIWSCAIPDICRPTPLLERCDYFRQVLEEIPINKSTVRLMRLGAGAIIKEHCDSFGDEEVRIHVPVTTNPEVEFTLEGQRVEMNAGSCWFLDFRRPHSVVNHGEGSRTHLVIDGYRNDWLEEKLAMKK